MTTILWADKHKPQTISNILGNKSQIYQITEWLKNYEKNKQSFLSNPKKRKKNAVKFDIEPIEPIDPNDPDAEIELEPIYTKSSKKKRADDQCSSLLLIGDHGVGKTLTATTILNELKYTTHTFNFNKLISNKNINETVENLTKASNILNKITGSIIEKPAVIIDGLEAINSPVEKNFISTLFKHNDENWYFPIIFITNGKHSKILSTLKENAKTIYFYVPHNDSLRKLLLEVSAKENFSFEEKTIPLILQHAQNDYRRLLFILQDLSNSHPPTNSIYTLQQIQDYCEISKRKDRDLSIFAATAELIANYQNIDECLRLYEGEKVIIPLMVQQNYIKVILSSSNNTLSQTHTLITRIAKVFAKGDLIENYIYSDQNWDMQQVHGILTCAIPSYLLTTSKLNENVELLKRKLDFPDDLNRTSIKRINKRNVINSNNCIQNMSIADFIKANKLIRKLVADNRIQECATLFSGYPTRIENIESILKIDKISDQKSEDPKKILSSAAKKQLTALLALNPQLPERRPPPPPPSPPAKRKK